MILKKRFVVIIGTFLFFLVSVSFSFGEGKIVYSTNGTGWKIHVMNEDRTNDVQLTSGPGRDAFPLWSPNGEMIYFHSNRETGGNPADIYELFVINKDGSGMRKLAYIPGANCVGGDWYYDGSKIGFTVNFGSNNNCVYWVNIDGTGLEPLYDAHTKVDFHSFSPDGNKMVFLEWGKLYIMNLDGTEKKLIANAQRSDWLPNTEKIVYVDLSGHRDIWTVNPYTLQREQLTFEYPTAEFFLSPCWSWPNAEKIVYNRLGNLWIMNPDGTDKRQLTFNCVKGEGSGDLYVFDDIAVTSPNGEESWPLYSKQEITWEFSDVSENVNIDLLKDDVVIGGLYSNISNSGHVEWNISILEDGTPIEVGTGYKIQVSTIDNSSSDLSDSTFEISEPPEIVVLKPSEGDVCHIMDDYTITWHRSEYITSTNVNISLYDATGTNLIKHISADTPNTGSFIWHIQPVIDPDQYIIRITTVDNLYSDDSGVFNIIGPSITVLSPSTGDTWFKKNTYPITWLKEGTMNPGVRINLYSSDGTSLIKKIAKRTDNDGSYEWTIGNNIVPGDYILRVETMDKKVIGDSGIFSVQ